MIPPISKEQLKLVPKAELAHLVVTRASSD